MSKPFVKKMNLTEVEFKQEDNSAGEVTAVVARINEVDAQGDVFVEGSVKEQKAVISGYNHSVWEGRWSPTDPGTMPIGKGKIYEEGKTIRFKGKFFTDVAHAEQQYLVVKNMAGDQEWSVGVLVEEYEVKERNGKDARFITKGNIPEVSPVFRGAQPRTRTVDIKSDDSLDKDKEDKEEEKLKELTAENEKLKSENFKLKLDIERMRLTALTTAQEA